MKLKKIINIKYICILLFAFVFSMISVPTLVDPDLPGHLMFGKYMYENQQIVRTDMYSYTAFNKKWIDHEWLSEIVFYSVFKHFKDKGLILLKIIILLLMIFIFLDIGNEFNANLDRMIFFISFILVILYFGLTIRPHLFTYLFMSCLIYIFTKYLLFNKKIIFAMPLIFLLWVNFHGGVISGILILLAANFALFIQNRRIDFHFLFISIISILITIINPYTYEMFLGIIRAVRNPYTRFLITEWQNIFLFNFKSPTGIFLIIYFLIFIYIVIKNFNFKDYFFYFISFCSLGATIINIRNIPLFIILSSVLFIKYLCVDEKSNIKDQNKLLYFSNDILLVLFLSLFISSLNIFIKNKTLILDKTFFPVKEINFLKKYDNKFKRNLCINFNWGQYAIYNLYPKYLVSYDGRYDTVYPMDVFEDIYIKVYKDAEDNFTQILDYYNTHFIIVEKNSLLEKKIYNNNEWRLIFTGNLAKIYERE